MAYNIDDVRYVPGTGPLTMRPSAARRAVKKYPDRPEINFVDIVDRDVDDDEPQEIMDVDWTGEGSGSTFATFLEALALTEGSADLVLMWESGDSVSGLRVVNGVATEHEVVMALGKPK